MAVRYWCVSLLLQPNVHEAEKFWGAWTWHHRPKRRQDRSSQPHPNSGCGYIGGGRSVEPRRIPRNEVKCSRRAVGLKDHHACHQYLLISGTMRAESSPPTCMPRANSTAERAAVAVASPVVPTRIVEISWSFSRFLSSSTRSDIVRSPTYPRCSGA